MLIYWSIYGLATWGLAALLNALVFTNEPARRITAWILTILVFLINLAAMTALQYLHYEAMSENLGVTIRPRNALDMGGALAFAWLFFSLLRKQPQGKQPGVSTAAASLRVAPRSERDATERSETIVIAQRTPAQSQQAALSEEDLWAIAAEEFDGSTRRKGLWAKAFADAQGNETVAKVSYLKWRVEQLQLEERVRQQEIMEVERPALVHLEQAVGVDHDEIRTIGRDSEYGTQSDVLEGAQGKTKNRILIATVGALVFTLLVVVLWNSQLSQNSAQVPIGDANKPKETTTADSASQAATPAARTSGLFDDLLSPTRPTLSPTAESAGPVALSASAPSSPMPWEMDWSRKGLPSNNSVASPKANIDQTLASGSASAASNPAPRLTSGLFDDLLQPTGPTVNGLMELEPPVPKFEKVSDRLAYLQWLATASEQLKIIKPEAETRVEFLETVWYESRRTGLQTSVVLALIDVASGFRKYAIGPTGSRGYMQIGTKFATATGLNDKNRLFHLQTNIRFGSVALRMHLDESKGDIRTALIRYYRDAIGAASKDSNGEKFAQDVLTVQRLWDF